MSPWPGAWGVEVGTGETSLTDRRIRPAVAGAHGFFEWLERHGIRQELWQLAHVQIGPAFGPDWLRMGLWRLVAIGLLDQGVCGEG